MDSHRGLVALAPRPHPPSFASRIAPPLAAGCACTPTAKEGTCPAHCTLFAYSSSHWSSPARVESRTASGPSPREAEREGRSGEVNRRACALRWLHGAQSRRPAAPSRRPDARRVARPRRAARGRHERRDRRATRHQHQHGQVPHLEHAREAGAAGPPRPRRLAPRRASRPPRRRCWRCRLLVVGGAAAGVGRSGGSDAGRASWW